MRRERSRTFSARLMRAARRYVATSKSHRKVVERAKTQKQNKYVSNILFPSTLYCFPYTFSEHIGRRDTVHDIAPCLFVIYSSVRTGGLSFIVYMCIRGASYLRLPRPINKQPLEYKSLTFSQFFSGYYYFCISTLLSFLFTEFSTAR